jgi:hypothetical protein
MTVVVKGNEKMAESSKKENQILPHEYNCEVILEKTTIENAKDFSFPNDAYLIFYCVNNETYIDLCRGTRVKIFDMYYDKYGPGVVQKIDFGYGRTNPKVWGYKRPDRKKRK